MKLEGWHYAGGLGAAMAGIGAVDLMGNAIPPEQLLGVGGLLVVIVTIVLYRHDDDKEAADDD